MSEDRLADNGERLLTRYISEIYHLDPFEFVDTGKVTK